MQPLKLTIPGQFWDSYIYSGRLYLFGMEGSIVTIDWDNLIESWKIQENLRLALECAFQRSDYLYGHSLERMFSDSEIRNLVRRKFVQIAETSLSLSRKQFKEFSIGEQDNPCPFPHSDCEIYYQEIYISAPSGVVNASANKRTKFPISTRVKKKWDAPVYGLSTSWDSLALAAGEEGLFELELNNYRKVFDPVCSEPTIIAKEHCLQCNWVFHSVFGSTESGGFLVAFNKENLNNGGTQNRTFDRVIKMEELWDDGGYAWGVQDKLCLATGKEFHILKYQPWLEDSENVFHDIGMVERNDESGDVLSASTAQFGIIVESERALSVYPSEGTPVVIEGEPVNWRVFPRSKHYENQLHVVWDDHLDILSFNQDYLVDQELKVLGVSVLDHVRRRN